jgi:hypothetical protein
MSRLAIASSFIVCVSFALLCCFVVLGQRPEPPAQPNQAISPIATPAARQAPPAQRLREGTAFRNMHVFFQQAGDRTVLFTVDDHQRFVCLENLTLERVLTTMQETPERRFWRIDGEFTEFRGENFVLIRRAVVAQPPVVTP